VGDGEKIHVIDHEGRHFKVRGPLNVPRSPQGHPLIVQAGSCEDGKDLAARYADAVFTAHQTLTDAQDFYRDLKATAAVGRDPESIKILPGIVPVIGATEAEALELERELDRLIKPEYARIQLAKTLRVAPEDLPLDRRLPEGLPSEDEIEGAKSRHPGPSCGRHPGMVRRRRGGRFQHHAAGSPLGTRHVRGAGGAHPAGARPVPD